MDDRRLRLFLAVVDAGSFTGAATAAHVSQPGVSQAVRELERELGTALFDRVGRRVRLTSAGEALVGPARQVQRDLAAGRAAVAEVVGLASGRLDLGCLPTLADDPTARVVGAFRLAHPGVTVSLAAPDDPADLLAMVRAGVVEIAFTERPRPAADLVVQPLSDQELLVVAPPDREVADERVAIRALADIPLVVTAPGTSSRAVVDEAFARARVEPVIAVETAQREALIPLVLAGAGTALLPAPVARTAERLGAVVRATAPRLTRTVALVHRDAPLAPAAQALRALAAG
jgi:LysR family transcriptional regulator, carnitine catabolism transcriptional activator